MSSYNGQVEQDKFVLKMLNHKKRGYFLELGSNDAIVGNNTYLLEKDYYWSGIMIDMDEKWKEGYQKHRKNSQHKICEATKIDFNDLLKDSPKNIDYLQIDLEPENGSTLQALINVEETMNTYKFAVVTFEHDIYRGNFFNTYSISRSIFQKYGYKLVLPNVSHKGKPFEDWYVHPDLVSNDYIEEVINKNKMNYKNGFIDYKKIEY